MSNKRVNIHAGQSRTTKKIIDDNLDEIRRMISEGVPINSICATIDISKTTFYRWKASYTPLRTAIEKGEADLDANINKSLLRMATTGKTHTKEVFEGENGTSIKIVERDKEPNLNALKHLEGVRRREKILQEEQSLNIIAKSDLRKMTDEELIELYKEIGEKHKEMKKKIKGDDNDKEKEE